MQKVLKGTLKYCEFQLAFKIRRKLFPLFTTLGAEDVIPPMTKKQKEI